MHTILRNTRWSALLIALVVLTVLTMMSTVFFEKLYRFSQASEGVENSNVSYYKALGIIEEGFYTGGVNKYTPWKIQNINQTASTSSGSRLIVSTGSSSVPAPWKGNSPYSADYNIIGLGEPVQLVIPENINWGQVNFQFRIPAIWSSSTGVLWWNSNTGGYILWTIASSGASLFASGETNIFKWQDLDNTDKPIHLYAGTTNSWSASTFDNFYLNNIYLGNAWAKCANFWCTLKLSLIRPVPLNDNRTMTFLEYKIYGPGLPVIPSQYMDIHAEWYAYGFLRTKDMKFPQITTNTALDFAVLQ